MNEIWKAIPGYENYEVSSLGRVRKGKEIKKLAIRNGYLRCYLTKNGKQTKHSVHAIVLLAFVGPRPAGYDVCHNDHVRSNNSLENLRYDTRENNVQDNIRDKRYAWTYPDEMYQKVGSAISEVARETGLTLRDVRIIVRQLSRKEEALSG